MLVTGPLLLRSLYLETQRLRSHPSQCTENFSCIRTVCKGAVQAICISRLSQQRIVHVVAVASFLIPFHSSLFGQGEK